MAVDDNYVIDEDTLLSISALGVLGNDTDADGDSLTAVLDVGPGNGTLTLDANGSFSYTPDVNFHGIDSFSYRAPQRAGKQQRDGAECLGVRHSAPPGHRFL